MEKNKRLINALLIIIMVLVIVVCGLSYVFFTKDKTKPIINPEEKKAVQNQEKIFSEENYPKVDGSIATLPLAEAFKANFTGMDIKDVELIHSNTHNAYLNLINGDVDLILVTYPSNEEKEQAQKNGIELEIIPIAKDAFVFFVSTDNSIENLTLDQIQNIYAGKIKNWKEVGGENEIIEAYQKPDSSVSQIGMQNLVMKGKKMMSPITETVSQNMSDIVNVISDYNNSKRSIGYSYYYYATNMYTTNKMKLLAIDGVDPTYENIKTGLYSLQTEYYAIIRKSEEPSSDVRKLLNTMKSERGQDIVKEVGYVQDY